MNSINKKIVTLIILAMMLTTICSTTAIALKNTNSAKSPIKWVTDRSHFGGTLNSIVYGKGMYVAVGDAGAILSSVDGKTWRNTSFQTITSEYELSGITNFKTVLFNGKVFVAAGDRAILYSKDGLTWKNVHVGNDPFNEEMLFSLESTIEYGITNGKTFILSGPGVLLSSQDGLEWTQLDGVKYEHAAALGSIGDYFTNVLVNNNKSICIRYNDDPFTTEAVENKKKNNIKISVVSSTDGIDWSEDEFLIDVGNSGVTDLGPPSNFTYLNGKYIFNIKGYQFESDNLKEWKLSTQNLDLEVYTIGNTYYKLNDGIYQSQNGVDFRNEYTVSGSDKIKALCSGKNGLVSVGKNGLILLRNSDGLWKECNTQRVREIYSAAASGKEMVAVGREGQIIRSIDGKGWAKIESGIKTDLNSILFDGKQFVTVGDAGVLLTSSDGLKWASIDTKSRKMLLQIKFYKGLYFAVGESSTLLVTKDLKNWEKIKGIDAITNSPICSVLYNNGKLYALRDYMIYTSKDGLNWSKNSNLGAAYIYNNFKGKFVKVGAYSSDLKSSSKITQKEIVRDIPYLQIDYSRKKLWKSDVFPFTDIVFAGTTSTDILYSLDGKYWEDTGGTDFVFNLNDIIKFKGKYYGFGDAGTILLGEMVTK